MGIDDVLRERDGVIARWQVVAAGSGDGLIERKVRRREWKALHPGVYVDHTGLPTLEQRRQRAVLHAWPAALAGESALIAHGARNVEEPRIRLAIDRSRRIVPPSGVAISRLKDFEPRVLWNRRPPRLRVEVAALEAASRRWSTRGEAGAVALLADLCQQRLTTPKRLASELEKHSRIAGRSFLEAVLGDVATGAFSLLEHRYVTRVERAHGLPGARRQQTFVVPAPDPAALDRGRCGYRDVLYPAQRLVVELDGRLGHEFAADQWADLSRDLVAATDDQLTVRVGWGLVVDACSLAPLLGQLLQARGWEGRARRCRDCPPISGRSPAPGAGDLPLIGG